MYSQSSWLSPNRFRVIYMFRRLNHVVLKFHCVNRKGGPRILDKVNIFGVYEVLRSVFLLSLILRLFSLIGAENGVGGQEGRNVFDVLVGFAFEHSYVRIVI